MLKLIKGTKRIKFTHYYVDHEGDYEGALIFGKAHGKGKLTCGVQVFEGDWVWDKFTKGKYTRGGELEYEGGWRNFEYEGKGKLYRNGNVYDCKFSHGEICGGKVLYENGDVYEGEMMHYAHHGIGKLVHPDGKIEEGHWYYDKYMGKGEEGKARIEAAEYEKNRPWTAEEAEARELQNRICP